MSPFFSSPLGFNGAMQAIGRSLAPIVSDLWNSVTQVASRIFGGATRSDAPVAVDERPATAAAAAPDVGFRVDLPAGEAAEKASSEPVTIHAAKTDVVQRDDKHGSPRSGLTIHPQAQDTKAVETKGASAPRDPRWLSDFKTFTTKLKEGAVKIDSGSFLRTSGSAEKKAMNAVVAGRGIAFGEAVHRKVIDEFARAPKESGPLGMEIRYLKAMAKTFNAIDPSDVADGDLLKFLKTTYDHVEKASQGAGNSLYNDVLMLTGYSPAALNNTGAVSDGRVGQKMANLSQSVANGSSKWGSYLQRHGFESLLQTDGKGGVRYEGMNALLNEQGQHATKDLQLAFERATAAVNNFCEACYLEGSRLLRHDRS